MKSGVINSHEVERQDKIMVRFEKSDASGGESPPSSAAEPPEFKAKVMNGKV
jgi:hypothetical protein